MCVETFVGVDEFYTFDSMEIGAKKTCRKINFDLEFEFQFYSALCSTHHGGKIFSWNHRSLPNSFFLKNGKKVS